MRRNHAHGKGVVEGTGNKREFNTAGGARVDHAVHHASPGSRSIGEGCGRDGLNRVKKYSADRGGGALRGEHEGARHHSHRRDGCNPECQ